MDTEFKVVDCSQPQKKQVMFHERVRLTLVGQFAKEMTQYIVMSQIANQMQGRVAEQLPNREVVAKACELAEMFYEAASLRGMLLDVPSLDELLEDDSSPPGFRAVG